MTTEEERELYAELVLQCAESVPRGRATTYGAIARRRLSNLLNHPGKSLRDGRDRLDPKWWPSRFRRGPRLSVYQSGANCGLDRCFARALGRRL